MGAKFDKFLGKITDKLSTNITNPQSGQTLVFADNQWVNDFGGGSSGVTEAVLIHLDNSTNELAAVNVQAGVDEIMNGYILKLIPAKPQNLAGLTFVLSSSYSAKQESVGTLRNTVVSDTTPTANIISAFYNGDSGTLSAEIDSVVSGSRILTTADDSGTYDSLVIMTDTDPYSGITGKEGFWKQLTANITCSSTLTYAPHTYQLKHSSTGNSAVLTLYVDNPVTPTSSYVGFSLSSTTLKYVSGIPSLTNGSIIYTSFSLSNIVSKFYNASQYATITSNNTNTYTVTDATIGVLAEGATPTISNTPLTVNNNDYAETTTFTITAYNSRNNTSTSGMTINCRIDTLSNETTRKVAGINQYPTVGYGGAFDSTKSLMVEYTNELQLLNGLYQRPVANYSSNLPVSGFNYSVEVNTDYRYYYYEYGNITNVSSFRINIAGTTGTWSGTETTGLRLYAKISGVTGWIDCNLSYPGVGSPINDGDAAMVFASSTAILKQITLGTTRTGNLIFRIGLPNASDKKFSGLSITNVV